MSTAWTSEPCAPAQAGMLDRLARRGLMRRLSDLRGGEITLEDATESLRLGQSANLHARLTVHDPRVFRHALLGGTLSVAESYVRGDWDCAI